MLARLLITSFLAIISMQGVLFADSALAQPGIWTFRIADFTVRVSSATPSDRTGTAFSGKGNIRIQNQSIPINFSDVKVSRDNRLNIYVATSGNVSGTQGAAVRYTIDAFLVQIDRSSIRITPDTGKAMVQVSFSLASCSADSTTRLRLSSTSCSIHPDGTVNGDDFRGATEFMLKDSVYRAKLTMNDIQSIRVGPGFASPQDKPGARIRGTMLYDGTTLFSFQGIIQPDAKHASFNLTLSPAPLSRNPVEGYELSLKRGSVQYDYGPGGFLACKGTFLADLRLPPSVIDEDNNRNINLAIELKTDKTGALFNSISLPKKLKVGTNFLVEAAKSAALVYIPQWHTPNPPPSYPVCGQKDQKLCCKALREILDPPGQPRSEVGQMEHNVGKRPGLTVIRGTLYFDSPQISCSAAPPAKTHKVKTIFMGGLTLTPQGITGDLTSSGNSFIPVDDPIDDSTKHIVPPRPTWKEIIDRGNVKPDENSRRARFSLSGLRILEMKIVKMAICMNSLQESAIRYFVHFPFPSFIDLEFEDLSLDSSGLFHQAKGPIAPVSWTFYSEDQISSGSPLNFQPQQVPPGGALPLLPANSLAKGVQTLPNPDTYILWAWRLPVSFADRGVTIDYGPAKPQISIAMDDSRQIYGEILNSEIWVPPLYSKNSAIKAGVRFSARMDSEGGFSLTGWDETPFFAKQYAKPSTEKSVGFECKLKKPAEKGIILSDAGSNPVSRPFDFRWDGELEFPFFHWQNASFDIKDMVPRLLKPTILPKTDGFQSCCTENEYNECGGPAQFGLSLEVRELNYVYESNRFTSSKVAGEDMTRYMDSGKVVRTRMDPEPVSIEISSYTWAIVRTKKSVGQDRDISPFALSPDNCGRGKWVKEMMKDAVDSSNIKDLVCYDSGAMQERGICDSCSKDYWLGNYQVISRDCETCADTDKTILSAPNVMYFYNTEPRKMLLRNSDMSLKSDETKDSHVSVIGIPGAQLSYTSDGKIQGAFGATLATVASSLPYEGEMRFLLDPKCGYYYFLGAGSFTYYLRFSGATFVVHAPYHDLTGPNPFFATTPILEDLQIRALYIDPESFKTNMGFSGLDGNTVITGVLNSGNVSFSYGIDPLELSLALGTGMYLFQFKDFYGEKYRVGSFINAQAAASCYIVTLGCQTELNAALGVESLDSLERAFNSFDFEVRGAFECEVCADACLGYCQAGLRSSVLYSKDSGLKLENADAYAGCGGGGCP